MNGFKPLAIDLTAKDVLPAKFAADAAVVFKDTDRIEVEPTAGGLLLRAIWEYDMEWAIEELQESLGLKIEHGPPQILYREEPRLLEPIMRVRLSVPEGSSGDVIGDLNRRRGVIEEPKADVGDFCRIDGLVPLANLFGYYYVLQRMTRGKGEVDVDFHGYEPVPPAGSDPEPSAPAAAALRARRTG